MNKLISAVLAASLATISTAAIADSANWTTEKRAQIDVNRNSDAGIGNGGERYTRPYSRFFKLPWKETYHGEDGFHDRDPGNSPDHNQACNDEGRAWETTC